MTRDFKEYLRGKNLSENTINSYLWTVNYYLSKYKKISREGLWEYKLFLMENYSPKTVNLRLQGMNKYLKFINKDNLKLKSVKIQQKTFLENVISDADYKFFKRRLKKDGRLMWYFIIRYFTATGVRVSELREIKAEHIFQGFFDIYSKGGKLRRLYIPEQLQKETLSWLEDRDIKSGYMFLNRYGNRMTTRGIAKQLKTYAEEYGIDTTVIYPHSFRHLFAKNFLERFNDVSFLADLMGHESIETTRIYLRKSSSEQKHIINKVVTW